MTWHETWHELGAPSGDEALHRRLKACWSEPHRHYHTLQHLGECLSHFRAVRHMAAHPGEVALALWFHDAYYDPTRSDNEQRSADWARDSVLAAGLPVEVANRVHGLVMTTRHEVAVATDIDSQLLVDIDLSILGAEAKRFDESDLQIRREYAHVPEDQYREGRLRILGGFLARPRLYHTDYFFERLERRARENLKRALARLNSPSS
jgi:predicted metal-dependent HD superfamily phosphohydrolase